MNNKCAIAMASAAVAMGLGVLTFLAWSSANQITNGIDALKFTNITNCASEEDANLCSPEQWSVFEDHSNTIHTNNKTVAWHLIATMLLGTASFLAAYCKQRRTHSQDDVSNFRNSAKSTAVSLGILAPLTTLFVYTALAAKNSANELANFNATSPTVPPDLIDNSVFVTRFHSGLNIGFGSLGELALLTVLIACGYAGAYVCMKNRRQAEDEGAPYHRLEDDTPSRKFGCC